MLNKSNRTITNYSINDLLIIVTKILIMSYFSIKIYNVLDASIEKYWIVIPIGLFLSAILGQAILKKTIFTKYNLLLITIVSAVITGIVIKLPTINNLFLLYEEYIVIILFFICFGTFARFYDTKRENLSINTEDNKSGLFNLFYINTSKVHEIAMLIDNKIMKTIENEKTNQNFTRTNSSIEINRTSVGGASLNHLTEDSNKESVYESFDVKTTKSIMLRTIYSHINKEEINKNLGKILLFKNVELKQYNTDDTVMVLNILRDGSMKQLLKEDNYEINLSKMIDELLDDFTIDYTFNHKEDKYLIRIPYKSKEYFENSYSHNDLQLGKLSIIGIYRGEIDFTNINSISSRFLEFFSDSYKKELERNNSMQEVGLQQSAYTNDDNDYEFKIEHKKLKGEHHLIDLIAIIQEIKIQDGESNV